MVVDVVSLSQKGISVTRANECKVVQSLQEE